MVALAQTGARLARAGLPGAIATGLELFLDPVLKVANGVAADAKLDEMQHLTARSHFARVVQKVGIQGWVEQSETHRGTCRAQRPLIGFAPLSPSYTDYA